MPFAQFRNACVHFAAAGQQQGADFYAVHRGEQAATSTSDGQRRSLTARSCAEMFQHMRNTALRAERNERFNAAGFDIAFVNDGGVQVTRHIDSAGRNPDQLHGTAPRTAAGWIPAVSRDRF